MIDQEKYVKVITNPLEKQKPVAEGVNNIDAEFTENGTYSAPAPYTGYGVVTVNVPENVIESLTITPTTSQQTISGGSGVDGYAPITVNAVTSTIDSNIQAQNIVQGTTILGVNGTAPSVSFPYRQQGVYDNSLKAYTNNGQSLFLGDSQITNLDNYSCVYAFYNAQGLGNISWPYLTNISGERCLSYAYAFCTANKITFNVLSSVTGLYAFYYAFYNSTITEKIEFPSLTSLQYYNSYYFDYAFNSLKGNVDFSHLQSVAANYAFYYAFYGMEGSVDFSALKTVTGTGAFQYAFYGVWNSQSQTYISPTIVGLFNTLESVTAGSAFRYGFEYNKNLTTITFSALSVISATNIFQNAFYYCTNLTSISFPALTSNSFGSSYTNQFNNMLTGVSGCTVHFPSNLQSVIGSWADVQAGFGGTNTTVLFDLTATE